MAFLPKTGYRCYAVTGAGAGMIPAHDAVPRIHVELLTGYRDWDVIGEEYRHGKRRWRVVGPDAVSEILYGRPAAPVADDEATSPSP